MRQNKTYGSAGDSSLQLATSQKLKGSDTQLCDATSALNSYILGLRVRRIPLFHCPLLQYKMPAYLEKAICLTIVDKILIKNLKTHYFSHYSSIYVKYRSETIRNISHFVSDGYTFGLNSRHTLIRIFTVFNNIHKH